jgi:CRISPR/Cas system-associated exonuclease Cas4 (RecB family)
MKNEGGNHPHVHAAVLNGFQFSQASLNDYVDCPRRFQLRYVLEQEWPAVESEPLVERERLADLGRRFHRLIQQRMRGLPVEQLTASASSDFDLARWWGDYLRLEVGGWRLDVGGDSSRRPDPSRRFSLPPNRQAEVAVSIPLGAHRLIAKYDLLATGDGRAVIVDWKTERRRPDRAGLAKRLQTRVYRYVLAKSDPSIGPESIAMVYWFAEYPSEPEWLAYDAAQFAADEDYLHRLLGEIENRSEDVWPLTPDERKCRFCTYRSLCDRGVVAGVADLDEFELDEPIDLDQIDEIAY